MSEEKEIKQKKKGKGLLIAFILIIIAIIAGGAGAAVYYLKFTLDLILILFLLIIPIHESAHALMAKWLGDDTAEKKGRISLNPIVHLDIAGLILMLFLGLGWAKPVPVNFSNLKKNRRASYALISAAGPLTAFMKR